MRLLYRAQHLFDAQMVLNLLQQHGLRGWVEGAALTGAAGDLPLHDIVRVMVHDDDCAAAQTLLRDWESGSFNLAADIDPLALTGKPPNNGDAHHLTATDTISNLADNTTNHITSTTSATQTQTNNQIRAKTAKTLCIAALLLLALGIIIGALRGFFLPSRFL